ncbi:MAG: homoserine dehydrogenase [Gammaproteobacteria bacterium]|nr:homoserine dehydrogenase [Gammaproteobacteria bacterium]
MNPLRIGVAGLGTVASGVVKLLRDDAERLARQAGRPLRLVQVASRTPKPGIDLADAAFSTDLEALHQAEVDVVVELIGGEEPALKLVGDALRQGRHVVTANKAIIARHGNELLPQARRSGVALGFEAAVAGGIPVLGALRSGLVANRVDTLAGIINGTSNYILTAMGEEGASFPEALAKAQELGFAEADPTFDIEGIDAAHKLTILAALAFDTPFRFSGVYAEGISHITGEDLEYANELGYRIKHLAIARRTAAGCETRVHPTLVARNSLLAGVDGVMNAVWIEGDATGPTFYYGPGAGALPTASAVLADLVAIARGDALDWRVGAEDQAALPIEKIHSAFYLRIPSLDAPGVFAEVATILGQYGISIEAAIQREAAVREGAGSAAWVPIVIVTAPVVEAAVDSALDLVQRMPKVVGRITRIRVAHFADE